MRVFNRRISSLFVLLILPFISFSQSPLLSKEIKVKLGTPYPVIDGDTKLYFTEQNTLLSVKFDKKKMFIQKMDLKTMRQINSREVTDLPNEYVFEGMVQTTGKLLFLYSLWDKQKEKEQLFYRSIDFDKGNFTGPAKLLLSIDGKITGTPVKTGMYSIEVRNKFNFETSLDSTNLLIRYRKEPEKANDAKSFDLIGLNVFKFNDEIVKVWGKEIKMPYSEKKMDELGFTVDSQSNAYLLAKVYEGDKKREKDKDGFVLYTIEVFKIDVQLQEFSKIKVSLPAKHIASITLKETAGDKIALSGFYSTGAKNERGADGAFFARLTNSGEIVDIHSYEFPLEIINQNASNKDVKNTTRAEKDESGPGAQLKNLVFDDLYQREDGTILFTSEQFRMTSSTSSTGNMVYYTYFYEDMVVMKIGADGKMAWIKRMPKNQTGARRPGNMSYKLIQKDGYNYFLYLDNIKNINLKATDVPEKHVDGASGFLTMYKIDDKTGSISKLAILDPKNVNGIEIFQFGPKRLFRAADGDFYMEVYKKNKEDVLLKISIAESK